MDLDYLKKYLNIKAKDLNIEITNIKQIDEYVFCVTYCPKNLRCIEINIDVD